MKSQFDWTIKQHQAVAQLPIGGDLGVPVLFRVRPITAAEHEYFTVAFCQDGNTCIYVPCFQAIFEPSLDLFYYAFTGNLGPNTTQEQFLANFTGRVQWAVDNNAILSCLAYGQTGSGKTYSMNAIAELVVNDIPYDRVQVSVSLVEILGDSVKDLLSQKDLRILFDSDGHPVVVGETFVQSSSSQETWALIQHGFVKRRTAATFKNSTSSRSHFVCKINLQSPTGSSQILLIDLAGSETNDDSHKHSPERMKESIAINQSLMALKQCIRAKSITKTDPETRIPYRNSKLTTLLKDLFVPSQRKTDTIFVATACPTVADVAHTLNTFRYACELNPQPAKTNKEGKQEQKVLTPMAWSRGKLENWFQTANVSLDKLLDRIGLPVGFAPPPWKRLYDCSHEKWVKALPGLGKEDATLLYEQYKALFLRPRTTCSSIGLSSGYGVMKIEILPHRMKKESIHSRAELAMLKAKEKGEKARKAAMSKSKSIGN